MNIIDWVKNKKFLVLGLGRSGYSATKLLAKNGAHVRVSDFVDIENVLKYVDLLKEFSCIEYEFGQHTKDFCKDADIIVVSPGIDHYYLLDKGILPKDVKIISELELGYLFCPSSNIIGITGTNGKSTTTELIGHILCFVNKDVVVCGNIGNPLTGEIDNITKETIVVIEISSFQLLSIDKFKPYISVLLNITDDHFDRHKNFEQYKKDKFRIFLNQTINDYAIVHSDFHKDNIFKQINVNVISFDINKKFFYKDNAIFSCINSKKNVLLDTMDLPIQGKHNIDNILVSMIVLDILNIEIVNICKAIKSFNPLKHRFEKVASINGIEIIDDSKATNIDATVKALNSLKKEVILIAGGIDKKGDYSKVVTLIKEKVSNIILIGKDKLKLKKYFSSITNIFLEQTMSDAVKRAFLVAKKEDTILLSPMCSSFDMFSSYKERGEIFCKEVEKYKSFLKK